ncbi:MAG: right-handed parallel beta-helix repeat-containing protein [gamma proteobacterium symbiont of Taylorina sp.]|nr:right-handed parallel beta-helix repeat-containing protein [gamma proteobacterium symbiont of Taylorina sp.]
MTFFISILCNAAIYEVGSNYQNKDLNTIDWPNLKAGDQVNIHWRSEPYRSKIGLRSRGTKLAPIRIIGIAGPEGQLPVLSGENATTPDSLENFFEREWTESLGVIIIHAGPDDEWGYKPGYLHIEGLKIISGHPDYQYTGMDGQTYSYVDGAAGIWAVLVEHLTVRNCEIADNGNGFFALSKNNYEEQTSRDVLVERNYIHNNGIIGSDQEHNIYTQVAGITFQYNRIGNLRAGAGGIALKDRSSNTVIRYNWIKAGARTLDLVEPEDSYEILRNEPGFFDTWVYGNIIINEYSDQYPYSVNMIHFGGDIGDESIYRKGTLHFFHNTVYIHMNQDQEWGISLFDLSSNDETAVIANNIFYLDTDKGDPKPEFYLARDAGNYIFESTNWLNFGWQNSSPDNEWHKFIGAVTLNSEPITGSSPGFKNVSVYDFSISENSPAYNVSTELPSSMSNKHPVTLQYVTHQKSNPRSSGKNVSLGALGDKIDPSLPKLSITQSNSNSLSISLDSGSYLHTPADWWLIRAGADGLFFYDLLSSEFKADITPIYQGGLINFSDIGIPLKQDSNHDYSYFFAIDLVTDSEIDLYSKHFSYGFSQ